MTTCFTAKSRLDKRYRDTEKSLQKAVMQAVSDRRIDVHNREIYTAAAVSPPTFYSHYRTGDALLHQYETDIHDFFTARLPTSRQRSETTYLTLLELIRRHHIYFGPTLKTYNSWLLAQLINDMRPILAGDKITDKCYDLYTGHVTSIIFCWCKHEHFSREKIPLYAKKLSQVRFIDLGI